MKRIFAYFLLTMTLLLSCVSLQAQSLDPEGDSLAVRQMRARMAEIRKQRPTVALVLSGGGAKGAAHVGVIRHIESLGIPVDMVLGTSMGGLIGGLYSMGYTTAQMDSLLKNMDWDWIFSDKLSRKYVSYTDTKYKEKYLLSIPFFYEKDYYRMMLSDEADFGKFQKQDILYFGTEYYDDGPELFKRNLLGSLPSGYVYGQNVSNLISSLTIGYQDSISFHSLPRPFTCIATDMVSGKTKVWHSGKLNDAMRSTMSIPGIFAPVRKDGMVLVDGGLRDNYPTTLAREMGADIIIGVDLSPEPKSYAEINNIGDIVSQGVLMLGKDALDRNIDVPDVKIRPDLQGFNMLSFKPESIDTIIVRGYQAALAQDSLLRVVADRTNEKKHHISKIATPLGATTDTLVIANIDIKGVQAREKEILMSRLNIKFGQKITKEQLDDAVALIYGTQSYDSVTYELLGEGEPFDLIINCRKGPIHQFGLGVRADTEEIVSVLLNLGFNVHSLHGHTFDFAGKISANPVLQVNWSYDMPKIPTLNAMASVRWTDLNMLNFGSNRLSFSYLNAKQEFYLSNIKWKHLDIKGGIRNEIINIKNVKSSQIIGDYNFNQLSNDFTSVFLDVGTYTFDDGYFPTKGVDVGMNYSWTFGGFPHHVKNFHTLNMDAKVVVPMGDIFAFIPSFNFRFLLGSDIPMAYFNAVGGSLAGRYIDQQLPFIGATHLVAMQNILTMYRTDFRFKVAKSHYLTGIFNYARDCDYFVNYGKGLGYFGAGVEYSFDTIFGPLTANIHWSNLTHKVGIYLSAGYNF